MHLVSAIITTHNRLNLLSRAIESVLKQTYSDVECIVVSDASTDGTNEYCSNRRDIRFIAISKSESTGGNHARNVGVAAAKGEYVAFLDDDDLWLPTKIEKQMKLIEETNCGFVFVPCRYELISGNDVVFCDSKVDDCYKGVCSRTIMYNIMTVTSCILMERALFIDVGGFDENLQFWQEYEFTIRLAQKTPFNFVQEALTVYRIDAADNNRLTNKFAPWIESVEYILEKHHMLYESLSDNEFLKYLTMVWKDASGRAYNAKLVKQESYFRELSSAGTYIGKNYALTDRLVHFFPLAIGILWYVHRRKLVFETDFLKLLMRIRLLLVRFKEIWTPRLVSGLL